MGNEVSYFWLTNLCLYQRQSELLPYLTNHHFFTSEDSELLITSASLSDEVKHFGNLGNAPCSDPSRNCWKVGLLRVCLRDVLWAWNLDWWADRRLLGIGICCLSTIYPGDDSHFTYRTSIYSWISPAMEIGVVILDGHGHIFALFLKDFIYRR
jgi:hypothetical protein